MPFSIRPYRRFLVQCSVPFRAKPFIKFPLARASRKANRLIRRAGGRLLRTSPHLLGVINRGTTMRTRQPLCLVAFILVVCISTVSTINAQDAVPSPIVQPFADNQTWALTRSLQYAIGNTGVILTVPRGFVTDFASIPKLLWWWLSPHDYYSRAAVVHDYLYWTQQCTRLQADNLLLIAMKESNVSSERQLLVYRGVRLGGESAWNANKTDRASGNVRIIPSDYPEPAPNSNWAEYRLQLLGSKVKEPPLPTDASYCKFGDQKDVPKVDG